MLISNSDVKYDILFFIITFSIDFIQIEELKGAVCHIIYFIYRHIPVGYESIANVRRTRSSLINAALCDHLPYNSSTNVSCTFKT